MKMKKLILFVSILLGLLTAVGIYFYVESQKEAPVNPIVYQKVAVALVTIPENTIITGDMVELRDVPQQAVHADVFTTLDDLLGAVTSDLIVKDEQILKSRVVLGLGADGDKLAYQIPENMRAISIPVNELSAVSGYIRKGDFIDILVTYSIVDLYPENPPGDLTPTPTPTPVPVVPGAPTTAPTTTAERLQTTVYTQFQKVEVLRLGAANRTPEDTSLPATMVLLVTPPQAEELVFALNTGSITLVLRNPADGEIQELEFYNAEVFRMERRGQ